VKLHKKLIKQVGTPTLPTAISLKSRGSMRATLVFNLFLHETMLAFNFQISFLRTSLTGQVCRPSLPAKSAGQVCRPSLPAKSAGQVCRPSLPAKSAGQACRSSLVASRSVEQRRAVSSSVEQRRAASSSVEQR
jgi:hypothetical protein